MVLFTRIILVQWPLTAFKKHRVLKASAEKDFMVTDGGQLLDVLMLFGPPYFYISSAADVLPTGRMWLPASDLSCHIEW
jgi:hypothetical protein